MRVVERARLSPGSGNSCSVSMFEVARDAEGVLGGPRVLVAQAGVDRQLRADVPVVLRIGMEMTLPQRRAGDVRDAAGLVRQAEHEVGEGIARQQAGEAERALVARVDRKEVRPAAERLGPNRSEWPVGFNTVWSCRAGFS